MVLTLSNMDAFIRVNSKDREVKFKPDFIPCNICNGNYILRDGKYGAFAGCNNFPKCKSTLKLPDFVLKYIDLYGIRIYRWNRECYKCGNVTPVYSYYLNCDLEWFYNIELTGIPDVGLADIEYVDKILSTKIPTIKMRHSQITNSKYMANTCEHCGALQGRNYVVDDPHEIIEDLWINKNMEKYLYAILKIGDVSKISQDIKRLFTI